MDENLVRELFHEISNFRFNNALRICMTIDFVSFHFSPNATLPRISKTAIKEYGSVERVPECIGSSVGRTEGCLRPSEGVQYIRRSRILRCGTSLGQSEPEDCDLWISHRHLGKTARVSGRSKLVANSFQSESAV